MTWLSRCTPSPACSPNSPAAPRWPTPNPRCSTTSRQHVPEPRKAPLAGSSVHMDRMFLSRDMPELIEHLHYRIIDVSSLKELVRRWYPRVYFAAAPEAGGHRALADIRDSIRELRYYRRTVLVPRARPTSEEARAAAQE